MKTIELTKEEIEKLSNGESASVISKDGMERIVIKKKKVYYIRRG